MLDQRDLIDAVGRAGGFSVDGMFWRHVSPDVTTLMGSSSGGRWGPAGTYPVCYLGRDEDSVAIEAYRHLVDDDEDLEGHMVGPRNLLTCEVRVTSLLDIRDPRTQDLVGLSVRDLSSDVGDYTATAAVGQAAHQLGMHGVIAPAAAGTGDTLALFTENLPIAEMPSIVQMERWEHLPPDPRTRRRSQKP